MTTDTISLAVWDVPMPVVAGGRFTVKVGAKGASGASLAGRRIEVSDAADMVVASGKLGDTPLANTEALYWTEIDVPVPTSHQVAEYTVEFVTGDAAEAAVAARFCVAATDSPEHTLTVSVSETTTAEALAGVEIRLGPFHARTSKDGRAELRVGKGAYQLHLWRTAHIAQPTPVTIDGDASVELTMTHVPEEHPDARWVR